jgi:hypothetical protein
MICPNKRRFNSFVFLLFGILTFKTWKNFTRASHSEFRPSKRGLSVCLDVKQKNVVSD